jgi:hypothetical protein
MPSTPRCTPCTSSLWRAYEPHRAARCGDCVEQGRGGAHHAALRVGSGDAGLVHVHEYRFGRAQLPVISRLRAASLRWGKPLVARSCGPSSVSRVTPISQVDWSTCQTDPMDTQSVIGVSWRRIVSLGGFVVGVLFNECLVMECPFLGREDAGRCCKHLARAAAGNRPARSFRLAAFDSNAVQRCRPSNMRPAHFAARFEEQYPLGFPVRSAPSRLPAAAARTGRPRSRRTTKSQCHNSQEA